MGKITQKQLIMEYVRFYGDIVPAKMSGSIYMGVMFGSETSRRCRELRKEGKLESRGSGKFEKFYEPKEVYEALSFIF